MVVTRMEINNFLHTDFPLYAYPALDPLPGVLYLPSVTCENESNGG